MARLDVFVHLLLAEYLAQAIDAQDGKLAFKRGYHIFRPVVILHEDLCDPVEIRHPVIPEPVVSDQNGH